MVSSPTLALEALDLQIQRSLIARIQQAARTYNSAPPECDAAPLQLYLSALEGLAEYVITRWRGAEILHQDHAAPRAESSRTAPLPFRAEPFVPLILRGRKPRARKSRIQDELNSGAA